MKRLLLLAWLIAPLQVLAEDTAVVRLEVTPETIEVGETARMRVTVLGPTWFARPPVFPSFEIPNAVVRLPPDSSRPTSERIGNDSWSGVTRSYEIQPLMPATYAIGGQTVRVTIASPGSDPIVVDAAIPEAVLRAMVPPGAEGLDPYIAGRDLVLSRELDRDPGTLEAGDAIVVTTMAEIEGIPAIFLPTMTSDAQIDGVSVYPGESVIEDGDTARRTEKLTLVFTAGGDFTLPGVTLAWWDRDNDEIATAALPELVFSVTGPPATSPADAAEDARDRDWKAIVLQVAGWAVLLYVAWRLVVPLSVRIRQRLAALRESEPYAFRQLLKACARGDARQVYSALAPWLNRLAPGLDAHRFAGEFGDAALLAELDALSASVYGHGTRKPDLRALAAGLKRARAGFLKIRDGGKDAAVPPLNP